MRRSIVRCKKCEKLVNVKLPKIAGGTDRGHYWGNQLVATGKNLSHDVFSHLFKCMHCGGKYS